MTARGCGETMPKEVLTVLQVNKLYHPWIGGIETAAGDIAEYLDRKKELRVINLVCQARGPRQVDHVNGVETYRAASLGVLSGMPISLDFFLLFKRLASSADIIILHHPFPLAFLAYKYFGGGKKAIVWYHSDIVKQSLLKIPFMPSLRYTLNRSARIVATNNSIIEHSSLLRDLSARCDVIYFGIDESKFVRTPELEKQAESLRQKYGSPLILAVGRLVYYKGFEYLIEAMNQVPGANLVIVGQGVLRPSLERVIESMGLQERVHIVDPVDDLRPYYYACDVFVLPSCEASEVFGIVQIEAMACGKPVINTVLPTGVPEVSIDWRTGRTVPPKNPSALADALHDVLDNQERYDRFCRNALQEVSARFTKARFFAALDRLIERAINPAGSALESRSADLNPDSIARAHRD